MSTRWDAFTGKRAPAPCNCGDPAEPGSVMCAKCLKDASPEEVKLALWRQEQERN